MRKIKEFDYDKWIPLLLDNGNNEMKFLKELLNSNRMDVVYSFLKYYKELKTKRSVMYYITNIFDDENILFIHREQLIKMMGYFE